MKATELNLEKNSYNFSCNTYKAGSHYKLLMRLGRCFPSTKAQAKYFVSSGVCLDVLNGNDVEIVESMLNKHGFIGDYKFTKSKTWVRLQNSHDLRKAIKAEFGI